MNKIEKNKVYKHYKGGLYIILDIATHSETLEKLVIYRALYGDNKLWARPFSMFNDEVNKNGQKYRFELVDIEKK